jgi:hypothetical protein
MTRRLLAAVLVCAALLLTGCAGGGSNSGSGIVPKLPEYLIDGFVQDRNGVALGNTVIEFVDEDSGKVKQVTTDLNGYWKVTLSGVTKAIVLGKEFVLKGSSDPAILTVDAPPSAQYFYVTRIVPVHPYSQ